MKNAIAHATALSTSWGINRVLDIIRGNILESILVFVFVVFVYWIGLPYKG